MLTPPAGSPVVACTKAKPAGSARLVVLSDTHSRHTNAIVPPGDVLIHCGDFTMSGTVAEARNLPPSFF